MRKLFVILFFVAFFVQSNAQIERVTVGDFEYITAVDNSKTLHYVRHSGSVYSHVCVDDAKHVKVTPSLDYVFEKTKTGRVKYWEIRFSLHSPRSHAFTMKKTDKIIMRLFDGTLINLNPSYLELRDEEGYGTFLFVNAKLSSSEFNRILSSGVSKLRIETLPYVCDAIYEKDEIGLFTNEAKKIIELMLNPNTSKQKEF